MDLHKYSGLDQSGYGDNSTNRFIDGVHQQIIQAVGDRDTHKYLWVTQRQDGMVVTVGQTSFKKVLHKGKESTSNRDDLFKQKTAKWDGIYGFMALSQRSDRR